MSVKTLSGYRLRRHLKAEHPQSEEETANELRRLGERLTAAVNGGLHNIEADAEVAARQRTRPALCVSPRVPDDWLPTRLDPTMRTHYPVRRALAVPPQGDRRVGTGVYGVEVEATSPRANVRSASSTCRRDAFLKGGAFGLKIQTVDAGREGRKSVPAAIIRQVWLICK